MQMSIYYKEEDQYLIEMVEKLADRKRMSKSAMILSILEEYFEANKRIGEILKDMRAVDSDQLNEALTLQQKQEEDKRIGEIMVERDYVEEGQLQRALQLQQSTDNRGQKEQIA
jgi:hypothetical protein